jgi:hypothetical protein
MRFSSSHNLHFEQCQLSLHLLETQGFVRIVEGYSKHQCLTFPDFSNLGQGCINKVYL